MKTFVLVIALLLTMVQTTIAQSVQDSNVARKYSKVEQEVVNLSRSKWNWMSEKKVDTLDRLFHNQSMFVHMGGTWGKQRELEVIRSGDIWYKKAEIYAVTVNVMGTTAIVLNDIDLVAVVGGNEVVNPFMVTEVYIKEGNRWKMGSLTFSRLVRAVKLNNKVN